MKGVHPVLGPVFKQGDVFTVGEISLRDLFAMAALQGLIASGKGGEKEPKVRAAYDFADLMLVERTLEERK